MTYENANVPNIGAIRPRNIQKNFGGSENRRLDEIRVCILPISRFAEITKDRMAHSRGQPEACRLIDDSFTINLPPTWVIELVLLKIAKYRVVIACEVNIPSLNI